MTLIHELLDRQAQERPSEIAIRDWDGATVSFVALKTRSEALAGLMAASGVGAGDRVMLVTENCAELAACLFAASRLGAWAVLINARMSAVEIDRIRAHAAPRLTLFLSGVSDQASAHAAQLNARLFDGGLDAVIDPSVEVASEEDVAVLLYTTGTTGDPKGVMLTHSNLCFAADASAVLRKIAPGDVVYGALPLTHVFGLASMLMASMFAGATIRMEARFTAERLYDALKDGVTVLPAVPQMHALLMQYARAQGYDRLPKGALRYVSSGGAPLDPDWRKQAEAFYGIALQNGYGLTECTAGVCSTMNKIGDGNVSVGPPLPGIQVRIDETVEGGGVGAGEVLTHGAHVMLGYYKNPVETDKVLSADGWFRTGDLGTIDDAGHLHILGRSKELIIRGGFNVYPPEVEAALTEHPHVVQAAVIGRIVDGDEQVLAFVQIDAEGSTSEAELNAFLKDRLVGYKRPSKIVTALALPAAPTGKPLKNKMLAHFADQL